MRDTLKQIYNIDAKAMIKCNDKVYQIKCDDGFYCLKIIDHNDDGRIKEKLEALKIDCFNIPIPTNQRAITTNINDKIVSLTPWISEEYIEAKDIKLKFYLKKIADLHLKSQFSSNISNSFYLETYSYINEKEQETTQLLDKMMEDIERIDYKSPSQWYYTLNYTKLLKSIEKSKDCLNKFHELTKDKSVIRQVITHQNFDYNHIFISKDKIISNEKMTICSPIFEIKSLYDHSYFGSIDLSGCLKEYFEKFSFEDYEIEWLLALLYIPNVKFYPGNDFKNLTNIMQAIFTYKSIEELDAYLHKK